MCFSDIRIGRPPRSTLFTMQLRPYQRQAVDEIKKKKAAKRKKKEYALRLAFYRKHLPEEKAQTIAKIQSRGIRMRSFLLLSQPVCRKCGEADKTKLTLDHILPVKAGGAKKSGYKNLQIFCEKCNWEKDNTKKRGGFFKTKSKFVEI